MVTWDDLNQRQRYVLQYAIDKGYYISGRGNDDDIQTLERARLIEYSGNDEGSPAYYPTNIGRALVASQQPPVADGVLPSAALVSRSMIADYVAAGDMEQVWDVIGDLQKQLQYADQATEINLLDFRQAQADLADARARLAAAEAALAEIVYLAPDRQPPGLLTTNDSIRDAYKLGYEWAQWEDAQIARKANQNAAGKPMAESAGE